MCVFLGVDVGVMRVCGWVVEEVAVMVVHSVCVCDKHAHSDKQTHDKPQRRDAEWCALWRGDGEIDHAEPAKSGRKRTKQWRVAGGPAACQG